MRRTTIALLGALAAAVPAAAQTRAQVAGGCGVGGGQGYGYSYLTSLKVSGTSCATGRRLARHHGNARGWRCHRTIVDRSRVQYDARMSCSSGHRRVWWTYTQNT